MEILKQQIQAQRELLIDIIREKFFDGKEISKEIQASINNISKKETIKELGISLAIAKSTDITTLIQTFFVVAGEIIKEQPAN